MISNLFFSSKAGLTLLSIHAGVVNKLADGDPFTGVKQLADDWQRKSIVAGLSVLVLITVITFLVLGAGGEDLRRKAKSRLVWLVLAAIGIVAAAAAIPWISQTGGNWFR